MAKTETHLALFDELEQAVAALDALRELGLSDDAMEVMTGLPYGEHVLGRPERKSLIPRLGLLGAVGGFLTSLFFNWGTPLLYPLYVGGQPLLSVPPTIVITFEFTMMGLFLFSIGGLIWEGGLAIWRPQPYHPEVSEGKIALVFRCSPERQEQAYQAVRAQGAALVQPVEATQP